MRWWRWDIPAFLKRFLPQSLFGRALMILVLPTIIVQAVTTHIFYDRHWENVSRWMASSLAGEIALLVHEINAAGPAEKQKLAQLSSKLIFVDMVFEPVDDSARFLRSGRDISPIFYDHLQQRINIPFSLEEQDKDSLRLRIKLKEEMLVVSFSRKRLVSSTTYIFISWMLGTALLLTAVAVIFLRNQIRPITKLSDAMGDFGKGLEVSGFRPQGAIEVRKAGRAFLQMRQRIERQISARMEMLAGISHDLRTPLTRMKLQLEMLGEKEAATELRRDIADMEHMIREYLDFVRGEGQEEVQRMTLESALQEPLSRYKDVAVTYNDAQEVPLAIRPRVFGRALMNVIENALRYGHTAAITAEKRHQHVELHIDDTGEGIPPALREEVFKPFKRLDNSRNATTGGVGLGLSITRDIIHGHGGDVTLHDAPQGGLRVTIRLPMLSP